MKLTQEEKNLFTEIEGLFFPFLAVKNKRGLKFKNDVQELQWQWSVLKNNFGQLASRPKFYSHILNNYGLTTLVGYLTTWS